MRNVEPESVRKAMDLAWRDHHHARDQTWKTMNIVTVIAAGLLTIDYQYREIVPTLFASILTIISAGFGVLITWNHRKLEKRKFIHIMNCEEYLGLHQDSLIPLNPNQKLIGRKETREPADYEDKTLQELFEDSSVKVPNKFSLLDIVNPFKNNTALFILRMHVLIILFSLLIFSLRILQT